ncbi:MAG: protoporphyrinogen oxidase [Pirellulales bacterium]
MNHEAANVAGKSPRAIAVIGGGIAGLAAAHRLTEIAPEARVTLFEADDRLGGILRTDQRDGYLIERSADMFMTAPAWGLDLCERVGLADELISTDKRYRKAFVVRRGKLVPVPAGFALMQPARVWPILTTPLLSWRGKLRLAMEYFVPRRHAASSIAGRAPSHDPGLAAPGHHDAATTAALADESLASFARRRLGREAFERLVQPLVGGIYTADPEKLSVAATLPRFLEMEREYRSLMRAAWQERKSHPRMKSETPAARASGARYDMFVAPRAGMSSLIEAICRRLTNVEVRLHSPAERLERTAQGRWRVIVPSAAATLPGAKEFDAVIVATPAHVTARLLGPDAKLLAGELRAIEYAGSAIVCLGYRRSQVAHPLNGFGFVVPAVERRRILAASFASVKFAGRAPDERVLIRVFIGGALQPEIIDRNNDGELQRVACEELNELLGASGEPEIATVARWKNAMPQYHVGHLDRVAHIEARVAKLPGLQLAGSAYHGVGVPHCIHSGQQAAERALAAPRS